MRETAQDLEIDLHSQSTASDALQQAGQADMATFWRSRSVKHWYESKFEHFSFIVTNSKQPYEMFMDLVASVFGCF